MTAAASEMATTTTGPPRSAEHWFITEVAVATSKPRVSTNQVSDGKEDATSASVRPAETVATLAQPPNGGSADVFRLLDRMGEKQTHSRNLRSLLQRAAQKTVLVVRPKNAMQAAENVTVRFNASHLTEVPRSVQLGDVVTKVLQHAVTSSSGSHRQLRTFRELFTTAPEVDALLKDLFWFVTAHEFQPGQHTTLERAFYERIADSFTSLFLRLQVPAAGSASASSAPARERQQRSARAFLAAMPDIVAQVLFVALYEAFPKSRKTIVGPELPAKLLRLCYGWLVGIVPSELSAEHWVPVDQESPKRIAALADFPAMRHRMQRAERVEKTKLAARNRHAAASGNHVHVHPAPLVATNEPQAIHSDADDSRLDSGRQSDEGWTNRTSKRSGSPTKSPRRHGQHDEDDGEDEDEDDGSRRIETRERAVFALQNSPLVATFLDRHSLGAAASRLRVSLRLSSGSKADAVALASQAALHASPRAPRERRRRVASDQEGFLAALAQVQRFGDDVRLTHARETKAARDRDAQERQALARSERALDDRFEAMRRRRARLHAFSNQLVSSARIEAAVSSPRGNGSSTTTPALTPGSPLQF